LTTLVRAASTAGPAAAGVPGFAPSSRPASRTMAMEATATSTTAADAATTGSQRRPLRAGRGGAVGSLVGAPHTGKCGGGASGGSVPQPPEPVPAPHGDGGVESTAGWGVTGGGTDGGATAPCTPVFVSPRPARTCAVVGRWAGSL